MPHSKTLTHFQEAAASQSVTMTSREIAELTGKEHKHVLRDIRVMLAELSLPEQGYAQNWTEPQNGQSYPLLSLPKDLTITLVSGYSVAMRHRIVTRWQELEATATPAPLNLTDPAALRTLLLGYTEKVLALETTVAEQAPKVAFADAVGNATNTQTVSQVAKVLGIGPRKLFDFLRTNGILMVNNLPFQHHIECGRFRVIEVPYKDGDGADHIKPQARVTGKGVTFIQQRLAKSKEVAHG
jgi:anti-repressor protein